MVKIKNILLGRAWFVSAIMTGSRPWVSSDDLTHCFSDEFFEYHMISTVVSPGDELFSGVWSSVLNVSYLAQPY